ncbi:uncharacterized protein BT62DRAFT_603606 [Guyanagaster necrorhizus]|uniref:Uncharacterized protein n=1 Tax=Guyanagaster necrorhizus TaxID=856835 RepID=A0A9P7VZP8_9AGAR|nr:uncharacterized protein BT62DRAFT_603606 [Guyanagaster necrorhizus MCA 3950]KAG7449725.1 hypothetical protein BT62DRAFT_603606 [Guyanagaster necrorhizus MCA 3950]
MRMKCVLLTRYSDTQEDQDKEDEEARRKATKDLVQSWMDRLQLISLIVRTVLPHEIPINVLQTTFFASVEAGLLQVSTPSQGDATSAWERACNAGLLGALVVHVTASFISFFAAFFLIRFKIIEANKEELRAGGTAQPDEIWCANPRLVQAGPFHEQLPLDLLNKCHLLTILLSVFGFALALMGILCLSWATQPVSVSIFTSACLCICLGATAFIFGINKDESLIFRT